MERKTFPAQVVQTDEAQGIIETIFAVMGNVDDGNDIIHPGAFSKTFVERGHKVRVLDQHRTDSVMSVLGKPMELREMDRAQLPPALLERVPEATGGAYAKLKFLMDTPEGKGAFIRLREGALSEWSFGYDALDTDYSQATKDGQPVTVRNLRQLKLYEISPVLFGMNSATGTVSAKSAPAEGKPYGVFHTGDEWCVHKIDEEGHMMGDSLGCHATEEEAEAQRRALYANVEDAGKGAKAENLSQAVEDVRNAFHHQFNTPNGPWFYWANAVYDEYIVASYEGDDGTQWFQIAYTHNENADIIFAPRSEWIEGQYDFMPGKSLKAGRVLAARNAKRIMDAMRLLHQAMADAGLMEPEEEEDDTQSGKAGPPPETPIPADAGTGPSEDTAPTVDLSGLIEIESIKLNLLEA
jgi:phage head maturation protease